MVYWGSSGNGYQRWMTVDGFSKRLEAHRAFKRSKVYRQKTNARRRFLTKQKSEAQKEERNNRLENRKAELANRKAEREREKESKRQLRAQKLETQKKETAERRKIYKRAYKKHWKILNKEKHREYSRKSRLKLTPDEKKALRRRYSSKPGFWARHEHKRRAKVLKAIPSDYDHKKVAQVFLWRDRVQQCLGIPFDIDHVLPLAAGGEHSHRNIQPLPRRLNMMKGANPTFELPPCWKQPRHGRMAN